MWVSGELSIHSNFAGNCDKVTDIRLKHEAAKVAVVVNAAQTKYMLVGRTEHDRIRLDSNVTKYRDTFEEVDKFVYIGSLLTAVNKISRAIRTRTISVSSCGLKGSLTHQMYH